VTSDVFDRIYPFTYQMSILCSTPLGAWLHRGKYDLVSGKFVGGTGKYYYLNRAKVPGDTFILFADTLNYHDKANTAPPYIGFGNIQNPGAKPSYKVLGEDLGMVAMRHGVGNLKLGMDPLGLINAGFLDGHAETLNGSDFVRLLPDQEDAHRLGFW
jgi:prepilin-type processing-associated H-X9-DG protein